MDAVESSVMNKNVCNFKQKNVEPLQKERKKKRKKSSAIVATVNLKGLTSIT